MYLSQLLPLKYALLLRMINENELKVLYEKETSNFYNLLFIGIICVDKDPTVGIVFRMQVNLILFSEQMTNSWCDVFFAKIDKNITEKPNVLSGLLNDIPKENGKYMIYRFVGLIKFMNVYKHILILPI